MRLPAVQIVRAEPADAVPLTLVTIASKAHWGYPQAWMEKWAGQLTLTPDYVQQAVVFKAVCDARLAGYYALLPRSGFGWLDNLFILPEFIGRGVGRSLFEHALSQCRLLGLTRMEWASDPHAAGFYTRMGARHMRDSPGDFDRRLPVFSIEVSPQP